MNARRAPQGCMEGSALCYTGFWGLSGSILLLSLLAGCGGNPSAPVEDRNGALRSSPPPVMAPQHSPTPGPGEYYVQSGDTLYSIAWRQGFDFRRLAAANDIPPPYTIYAGQKLKLQESASGVATGPGAQDVVRTGESREAQRSTVPEQPSSPSPLPSAAPKDTVTAPSTDSEPGATASVPQPETEQSAAAESSSTPITAPATQPVTKPATKPAPAPEPAKPVAKPVLKSPVGRWRWPAEGRVVREFSGTVHKGIDIGGERGDAVVAVADGVVVYAGTGIVGFGELLIVKHDDTYLSAYGHNERLLVREGASVSAGQQIAKKGSSGTDSVKLHFEIRKNGKPINPLQLLPKR